METLVQILAAQYNINTIPTYQAMRCSARKTNGTNCTVCSDICPQGIYPEGKRKHPDWTHCVKCGICAANCPDRCITFPSQRVDNFLIALAKSGDMGMACAEDDTVFNLTVSCLAAVSWEQMAIAALRKGLVISLRACSDCPRENFRQLIEQNIEQLRSFLGDELFNARVRVLRPGDEYVPMDEGMSRRELFNFFKTLPLDKALGMLPKSDDTRDNGLFYRMILRDEVQRYAAQFEPQQRPKFRVKLPVFTDKCYNCGVCVRTCPQKALQITRNDDKLLVTIEAWRCVGCGICQRGCRAEAISSLSPMRISTIGKVALKKIPVHPCADCGKPRPADAEDGICSTCAARRRAVKAAEERKARLDAERKAKAEAEAAKAAAEAAAAEAAAEAAKTEA